LGHLVFLVNQQRAILTADPSSLVGQIEIKHKDVFSYSPNLWQQMIICKLKFSIPVPNNTHQKFYNKEQGI
jgi:hypothetical protein